MLEERKRVDEEKCHWSSHRWLWLNLPEINVNGTETEPGVFTKRKSFGWLPRKAMGLLYTRIVERQERAGWRRCCRDKCLFHFIFCFFLPLCSLCFFSSFLSCFTGYFACLVCFSFFEYVHADAYVFFQNKRGNVECVCVCVSCTDVVNSSTRFMG